MSKNLSRNLMRMLVVVLWGVGAYALAYGVCVGGARLLLVIGVFDGFGAWLTQVFRPGTYDQLLLPFGVAMGVAVGVPFYWAIGKGFRGLLLLADRVVPGVIPWAAVRGGDAPKPAPKAAEATLAPARAAVARAK